MFESNGLVQIKYLFSVNQATLTVAVGPKLIPKSWVLEAHNSVCNVYASKLNCTPE
jgi:hypothetical protein